MEIEDRISSVLLEKLCRTVGIDKTRTTVYHHQNNGQNSRRPIPNESGRTQLCYLLIHNSTVLRSTGQKQRFLWGVREWWRQSTFSRQPPASDGHRIYATGDRFFANGAPYDLCLVGGDTRSQKDYYDKKYSGVSLQPDDQMWFHRTQMILGVSGEIYKKWRKSNVVQCVLSEANSVIWEVKTQQPPFMAHFNQPKPYLRITGLDTQ